MAKSTEEPEDFDKRKLARLQTLIDRKRNDLASHYEVGQLVKELVPNRNYGRKKKLVELLVDSSKKVSFTLLYTARDFAKKYRKQDLPKLDGLSFAHVARLLRIRGPKRRNWYRQECQKHGWSTRQLSTKVYEAFGKRSKSYRPFKEGDEQISPLAALLKVLWLRDAAINQCMPMLEHSYDRLPKQMSRQPDGKFADLVADACTALDALNVAVKDARTPLGLAKGRAKSAARLRSG
jgi:hypothetical protein